MKLTFILFAFLINFFPFIIAKSEEINESFNNQTTNILNKDLKLESDSKKEMTHIVKLGDTITSLSKFYSIKKERKL